MKQNNDVPNEKNINECLSNVNLEVLMTNICLAEFSIIEETLSEEEQKRIEDIIFSKF